MANFIFGTGTDGRRVFRYLKRIKKKNLFFFDNDKKKNNKKFFGTKVYNFSFNKKFNVQSIYLGGRYMDDQFHQIKKSKYFGKVKIIKTDRWKYVPSVSEIKSKENDLKKLLQKIMPILIKKIDFIADASTLLGLLRKNYLSSFSDLDFAVKQSDMKKLHSILKKNLSKKKYKILIRKYKKRQIFFNKKEIHQIVVIEKCDLKKREPLNLDFCPEKKVKNYYYKIADEIFYSKVPEIFRKKIILKKYKDRIFFPIPKNFIKYVELCYGKSWKRRSKRWKNSQSKRYRYIKNF